MSSQQDMYMNNNINYSNENQSKERIRHLEKENSDLLERNKNLEDKLKQLEKYISSTQYQTNNANIYNINLNNTNNNNNNKCMTTKNKSKKNLTKAPSYSNISRKSIELNKSKNSNLIRNKKKNNQNLNNSRKNINTFNSQYLSTKKSNKSFNMNNKSKILPSNTLDDKSGIFLRNERERDEYNIKILNEMIKEKKKEIESLEYELKLQNLAKKGEGYLDYELNLWQKKTNTLSTVFYQQFNTIKSEAYLDKNEFQNLIHNMKKICETNQSYEENLCEEILNKQNWFINNLNNKNKDIRKRLEKMKNIFK